MRKLNYLEEIQSKKFAENFKYHHKVFYRWRKEYGGLEIDQAKRLKELERENSRLKRLVADQALDNAMLKDVASGNF